MQENLEGKLLPVQCASKKLMLTETRYSISEKEMLAILFGVEKFACELRGRKFHLLTDNKALERIRNKPEFNNNKINRFIEKLQDYDFSIEYRKGEEMVDADALSRIYEEEGRKECKERSPVTNKGKAIQEGKLAKHIVEIENNKYWQFKSGVFKLMPEVKERKKIIKEIHENLNHRGYNSIMYEIKKKYYWYGISRDI